MAKIKNATFGCPVCGQTVEMHTVAEPVLLASNRADWDVSVDTESLRAHLAEHVNSEQT